MPTWMARVVTAVLLAILLIVELLVMGPFLRVSLVAVMLLSLAEVYMAMRHKKLAPAWWVGGIFGVLCMPVYLWQGLGGITVLFALCVMLGFSAIILRGRPDYDAAVATVLPLFYPGMLVIALMAMQDIAPRAAAVLAYALAFVIAFSGDIAAYEIGSRFGKTKLTPHISPNKTVEGALASLVASVLGALLVGLLAPLFAGATLQVPPAWQLMLLGLVGGAFAQLGDLTASMLKRHLGTKDFGHIFPGHGGLLDRMDSALFSAVIVYAYFAWVVL